MRHFPPVGGNHVGGGAQAGGPAEFGQHLAARKHALGATGVFGVGQVLAVVAAQAHGVFQQPAAVGVQGDAGVGKALVQGHHGLHFLLTAQHAAFEFEVLETIARVSRFSQPHDATRIHGRLVAQAQPVVTGVGLAVVGQVGALAVGHIKQVAQHRDLAALLALAQQGRHGHVQVLSQQVQQRAFHGGDGMDGHAQVKGLQATATTVLVGKSHAQGVQNLVPVTHRLAQYQGLGVLQGQADFFAAGHFAHAGVAVAVGQDDQVAREKRAVSAAQVQQHPVMAGHRDDLHAGDGGGAGGF